MATKVERTLDVPMQAEVVDHTIECGFRVEWMTLENEDMKIDVTCGAGTGSRWLIVNIDHQEKGRIDVRVDMAKAIHELIERVTSDGED